MCGFKVKSWSTVSKAVRGMRRNGPWGLDGWKHWILDLKQFTLQFLNSCNIIFQQASSLQHLINHTLERHFNSKRFQSMWQVKDAKLWREQWNGLWQNQGNPYNTKKIDWVAQNIPAHRHLHQVLQRSCQHEASQVSTSAYRTQPEFNAKNINENRGWFPFPLIMPTRIMTTSNLKEVQVLLLFSSISTFQIITLDDS